MKFLFAIPILMAFTSEPATARQSSDGAVCESYLALISESENVPLGVLYAVGMTETGVKGSLHPYALNIEGKSVIANTADEALKIFAVARKQGKVLIDLGCMQVNHHYHGANFSSPAAMLDPEVNITYAARYLRSLYQRKGDWASAVALYHASPRKPLEQRRYICSVLRNLIASGFGGWTDESRNLCRR